MRHIFTGRCHCGNLEIQLETDRAATDLQTRRCACGFCSRHGARTVTDTDGIATITLHKPEQTRFYSFGLGTADFLICGYCGVYGAAVMEHDSARFATLNVNLFEERDSFPQPVAADYESETAADRRARRAARWTPVKVVHAA